jgi:6,7-dimethyl-8-ribityllumazine synthase
MAGPSATGDWTMPQRLRPALPVLIIEARYYEEIGQALLDGALAELKAQGVAYERVDVPGALEIPQVLAAVVASGALPAGQPKSRYCGTVLLGCVIRGETSHYDIVCNNANHWAYDIAMRHAIPLGNAILTVDTERQAMERAAGSRSDGRGGKGADAVRACLKLVAISNGLALGLAR